MTGKVKCTCGWSWNKSDSSKKDMYICHECGRDNSNNMKNGGWLDNYNDSQASAPEGMEGDGYSNVGRNYSPAWGGQFKDGGPIYTTNPKDPRLQAYKDSSILYNNYLKQYSAKGKNRPLTKEEIKLAIEQRENPRANYPNTKVLNVKGSNKVKKYHYYDNLSIFNITSSLCQISLILGIDII